MTGETWQIEVRHEQLNKYQVIRGKDKWIVEQRAEALRAQWAEAWAKREARETRIFYNWQGKEKAAASTEAAEARLSSYRNLLATAAGKKFAIDWASLKQYGPYPEDVPAPPVDEIAGSAPAEPFYEAPAKTFVEVLIPALGRKSIAAAKANHDLAMREYEMALESHRAEVAAIAAANTKKQKAYEKAVRAWEERRHKFLDDQEAANRKIDGLIIGAQKGEPEAMRTMLELALSSATLPEPFGVDFELDYDATIASVAVDFMLPAPDDLPTEKEFRFVQSRGETTIKHLSDTEKAKIYDSLLYQIALRSLHVMFSADEGRFVRRATFNGWVDYVDRATGMDQRSCILSLAANRGDFDRVDLERVDPKECFRAMKGVAASKLIGLAPVAPLQRPRLQDSRFIPGEDVASNMNPSVNVAAMDWKDFEHLVRQVFEHVFSTESTEVKVTQASRDGGVDAIVFDPDPIRGGKIIIQAKRYTNTVDVSAVRDLYGTAHNEGATKGILVTTSQFGPDARKFAQGKPLTLIDGGQLLYLLEEMGVQARIDLREAKATLAAQAQTA